MIKYYCDRCGKEGTDRKDKYFIQRYDYGTSYMQKDLGMLCNKCFNEFMNLVKSFLKE